MFCGIMMLTVWLNKIRFVENKAPHILRSLQSGRQGHSLLSEGSLSPFVPCKQEYGSFPQGDWIGQLALASFPPSFIATQFSGAAAFIG
jgi:hypothetical protein